MGCSLGPLHFCHLNTPSPPTSSQQGVLGEQPPYIEQPELVHSWQQRQREERGLVLPLIFLSDKVLALAMHGEFNLENVCHTDSNLKAHVKMIYDITSASKQVNVFTETCWKTSIFLT